MRIETAVNLRAWNTFGLPAIAQTLIHIDEEADVRRVVDHPEFGRAPKFVLGGGSNIVLARLTAAGGLDKSFGADGGKDGTPDGVVSVSLGEGVARAMGGDITVESAPGAGTTFRIYLPRVSGDPADATPTAAAAVASSLTLSGYTSK